MRPTRDAPKLNRVPIERDQDAERQDRVEKLLRDRDDQRLARIERLLVDLLERLKRIEAFTEAARQRALEADSIAAENAAREAARLADRIRRTPIKAAIKNRRLVRKA